MSMANNLPCVANNVPARMPAVLPVGGMRGIALEMQSFPNGVAMVQDIKRRHKLNISDNVQIINWEDLSTIGTSCMMMLESKEWTLEVVHRLLVPSKTLFMYNRVGAYNPVTGTHDNIPCYLLLDQVSDFWTKQVDMWINEYHRDNVNRDAIRVRMLGCLRVNTNPNDRYIELSMYSPM